MNDRIILELTRLADLERNHHQFKYRAYMNAINSIKSFPVPITRTEQIASLPGIGKSIYGKIEALMGQRVIDKEDQQQDTAIELMGLLLQIYGVGEKKAKELIYDHKIQSLLDLRQRPELLNAKQQLGLKYYDQLLERIPYKEMLLHERFLGRIWGRDELTRGIKFRYEIVGSFRRKRPTSGDIDILVTFEEGAGLMEKLIGALRRAKYVVETLAEGSKKFMGICRLPHLGARRIDLIWAAPGEYPFALFYFTGSDRYNRFVREEARRRGYRLNERSMEAVSEEARQRVMPIFKNEKDITDFLGLPYLRPEER